MPYIIWQKDRIAHAASVSFMHPEPKHIRCSCQPHAHNEQQSTFNTGIYSTAWLSASTTDGCKEQKKSKNKN